MDAPPDETEDYGTKARVFSAILLVLVLILVGVLYTAMSRDRDKERGKELFARQRHHDALGYFLKSEQSGRLFSDPELLYLIAITYERIDQCERSVDYFYKMLKEFPETDWEKKAKSGILRCLIEPPPPPGTRGPPTDLVLAKKAWRKGYNRLVAAVRENRSGVSAELEQAYREYKEAYEAYVREIKAGMIRLDAGSQ